ncbi:hypothetical protein MAPG_06250 [Magnaporthiopsis poae ATCC 64411]|uniref:Uncharacterized protein n=1 Tax=Magnaporthiopsis poae (strain ATCC 64411 / 73-15) TaxID=644358 RepID=A0A0C4E1I8_MAGP6|nr:hypothetical protein MAPG_06250 [Magnaporthiopsis poae ATCC 64411]
MHPARLYGTDPSTVPCLFSISIPPSTSPHSLGLPTMASPSFARGIIFPTLFTRYNHETTETMDPVATDSAEFACLTSIARLGLVTLEGTRGREALEKVGHFVLEQWQQTGRMDCDADPSKMCEYVDHFLERVRDGFPSIVVDSSIENRHSLPITSRVFTTEACEGAWDGDRANFVPGTAMTIAINAERFRRMVTLFQRFQNQKAGEADDQKAYMDYITFQFILGARIAYDLCQAFVVLLAGNQRGEDFIYPRPRIDRRRIERHDLQEMLLGGEPGRYLQHLLYGGYLEIFGDPERQPAQPGFIHVVNRVNLASVVSSDAITGQIWCTGENGQFPLGTEGCSLSLTDGENRVWNDKVIKMAYDNHTTRPEIRSITPETKHLMRELLVHRSGAAFRVAELDMRWVATQPGRFVRADRVQ